MHTFKKKKSDGQKDDMRFLTLVTGNFHGILHHVVQTKDTFWRSAGINVFEWSPKWFSFMLLMLFCSILALMSSRWP